MRRRILINYITVLILSALITGIFAFYFINNSYSISKEEKFRTNMALIQNILEENYSELEKVNFYKLTQELSSRINSRVTFISVSGVPIADSLNNSIIFQNLAYSQEYRHAIKGDNVIVKGYSLEIGKDFFYLATYPVKIGQDELILRLGDTHDEVSRIIEEFMLYLVVATVISVVIAMLIAFITVGKIIKPVKELTLASKLITEGNFDNKIVVNTRDEIYDLAVSFNQMTEDLKQTIGELKRLEKMRKDFVANVSHELRTPLTSIGGFVETLKIRELDDESKKKALDIIELETERLKGLINELLILSKIESLIDVRELLDLNIKDSIDEVLNVLEGQIREKDIKLVISLDKDLNKAKLHKDLLKQLLINLIDNGIKYSNPGGEIKLEISNSNNGIKIIVEDKGIGIPEEDIPWIFERFYRVDNGRIINENGTGLGLAIVDSIVSYFKGTIKVESEIGIGTRFTLILPGAENIKR